MAARVSRRLLIDLRQRSAPSIPLGSTSRCSSTATTTPKIPHFSKKGRLLTGATIGFVIAGGAYVSTVDEATFWYLFLIYTPGFCSYAVLITVALTML